MLPYPGLSSMINVMERASLELTVFECGACNFVLPQFIFVINSVTTLNIITQRQNDPYNVPVIFMDVDKATIGRITNERKSSKTCSKNPVLLRDNKFSTVQFIL